MNKQKIIIIVLILVILGCLTASIIMIKNNPKNQNELDNFNNIDNQEVLKNTEVEGLTISNQILSVDESMSTYKAIIANTTDKSVSLKKLYITFTKEQDEFEVIALSNISLDINEEKIINVSVDRNLKDVKKIDYRIEK